MIFKELGEIADFLSWERPEFTLRSREDDWRIVRMPLWRRMGYLLWHRTGLLQPIIVALKFYVTDQNGELHLATVRVEIESAVG